MLQIDITPYASDALEDAMRLAQTKALNSYTFSECLDHLNYTWSDLYQQIAMVDEGFYSKTMRLTSKLTKLPCYVKNTLKVYESLNPNMLPRMVYRPSGTSNQQSYQTYQISGFDLYCPSADLRTVWLNYLPQQSQMFFTHHNRDPKIFTETVPTVRRDKLGMYVLKAYRVSGGIETEVPIATGDLSTVNKWVLKNRKYTAVTTYDIDISDVLIRKAINMVSNAEEVEWKITYIDCASPYVFVSYEHLITGEHLSGFFVNILNAPEWTEYNPFAWTGRPSNVEYITTDWNDKTGMGVVVKDYADNQVKELGWTPDTKIVYPDRCIYRLLVAKLAERFSSLNESSVMAVMDELTKAQYAFDTFLKKNQAGWGRIDHTVGLTMGDFL